MALSRKPQRTSLADDQIDALISKGGEVPSEKAKPTKAVFPNADRIVPTQLRLPQSKLDEIDALSRKRRVKVSRHSWFLEAIEEKLERDGNG